MNAAFHDGRGMVAPFALFHVKPSSIDDYSILVWMPKICTKTHRQLRNRFIDFADFDVVVVVVMVVVVVVVVVAVAERPRSAYTNR